jgi:hypothetical protein
MRNVHLLTGNLTRTACGHVVWSIYPHEGKATAEHRKGSARIVIHVTLKPHEVRCPACGQVMNRKANIRITSDVSH